MGEPYRAYEGRAVLITGGLGFIGSNLARRLVDLGPSEITLLDALIAGHGGNSYNIEGIEERMKVVRGDMRDESIIAPLVERAHAIFNLAGQSSHLDSMRHPHRDLEINCAAQLSLLEACRRFNPGVKVVFTSTRQVYGKPLYLPVDEEHRLEPIDVNGVHKLAAERYHLLYHRLYGTAAVCLRLTNTYGPRQSLSHDRQGFLAWFIRQALDGGVIDLFGEGRARRDLNHVDDVVEALLLAGASDRADGEIFNLGGDEFVSLMEIATALAELTPNLGVRNSRFPAELQLIDIGDFRASYAKIEAALGWRPQMLFRDGLARTLEFYRRHRAHY